MLGSLLDQHERRTCNHRILSNLALAGVIVGWVALAPISAEAAFAGHNGEIVFTSNRGNVDASTIWVMHPDGRRQRQLAIGEQARWSPDGRKIAYVRFADGARQVWTMNGDGTAQTQVTHDAADDVGPAWSADGKRIVFQRQEPQGSSNIYEMNADGTQVTRLTEGPAANFDPATSAYGQKVVFARMLDPSCQLYVLSGKALQQVTHNQLPGCDVQPNWSPKGNDIAFSRRSADGSVTIYVTHKNGVGLKQLTNTPGRQDSFPAWSPDGRKIVFRACTEVNTPAEHCTLHVINADGTGDRDITIPDVPFADDFNDNRIDAGFWSAQVSGGGPSVAASNGRVEVTVPAKSTPDPASGSINVGLSTLCTVQGDYDVRVDYSLLEWPVTNGDFQILLGDGIPPYDANHSISRGQFPAQAYLAFFSPSSTASAETTDASGTMRLVRSGSTTTAFFMKAGNWIPLNSGPTSTADSTFQIIALWFGDQFGSDEVKIAFDNFTVNQGRFSCPTWWRFDMPDWQPT